MGETPCISSVYGADLPTCPHCGDECENWHLDTEDGVGPGVRWTITCAECGEDFAVSVRFIFDTEEVADG